MRLTQPYATERSHVHYEKRHLVLLVVIFFLTELESIVLLFLDSIKHMQETITNKKQTFHKSNQYFSKHSLLCLSM